MVPQSKKKFIKLNIVKGHLGFDWIETFEGPFINRPNN